MSIHTKESWALVLGLALAASAVGAETPRVELSDGGLPLWEIRPLDRRVYVVSLDGAWKQSPAAGAKYQLVVTFPDGTRYSHRPMNKDMFLRGEMRFMVPEHLLRRTGTASGGKLTLSVVEAAPAGAKPLTISNGLELTWPLKRRIARTAPRTKFSPPPPIDAFPLPEDK